ncbi:hypothetical protein Bca101_030746 [Brassica carinata]
MAMVTSNGNTLLKAVKPFKTGWKVEIKVLHSWTQHSSYGGGDTLEFILADVTVTNAFEASSVIINPTGSDVNEFLRQLPKNELALTTGNVEVVKPKGIKRQKDTWCIYPERSIVDIIMATETEDYNDEDSHANALSFEMTSGQISLLSNENEDGTCSASTPLSKRSGDNQIDDLASTTKKHCSKAIKMEKKIKVEKIEGE